MLSLKIDHCIKRLKDLAGLSDDEIAELKEIEKKQRNPYGKWVNEREEKLKKTLKTFPSFLKRGF